MTDIYSQIQWLFILAIPIACIAWTITKETLFEEPRNWCVQYSKNAATMFQRKIFYLFTCEYCFSHYVAVFFLILTDYKLLLPDWRGYLIAGFALVFVANFYMSLFALLRQAIKKEKIQIDNIKKE